MDKQQKPNSSSRNSYVSGTFSQTDQYQSGQFEGGKRGGRLGRGRNNLQRSGGRSGSGYGQNLLSRGIIASGSVSVSCSGQFRPPSSRTGKHKKQEEYQKQFKPEQLLTKLKPKSEEEQHNKTYFGDGYILNEVNQQPSSYLYKQNPEIYWRQAVKRMPRKPYGPLVEEQVRMWDAFENSNTYYYQECQRDGSRVGMRFFVGYDGRLWRAFGPNNEMPVWKCRRIDLDVPTDVKTWFYSWDFPWDARYQKAGSSEMSKEDPILREIKQQLNIDSQRQKVLDIFKQLLGCGKKDRRMAYSQTVYWYGEELCKNFTRPLTEQEMYNMFEQGQIPLDWKLVGSYVNGDWYDLRHMVVSESEERCFLKDQQMAIYSLINKYKNGGNYLPWKSLQTQDGTYTDFIRVHGELDKQFWLKSGHRIESEADVAKLFSYFANGSMSLREQPFWMLFCPTVVVNTDVSGHLDEFRPWLPLTALGLVKCWVEGELHQDIIIIPIDSRLAFQLSEFQHHRLLLDHWTITKQRQLVRWENLRSEFSINIDEEIVRLEELQETPQKRARYEEQLEQMQKELADKESEEFLCPVLTWVKMGK